MGMRDYQNLKDIIIPEAQEKIMDIYCAAWEDCRNMGHCEDCPDRQMLKEKFSLLECFSLKYSRMLIEAGYAPVVHAKIKWVNRPISAQYVTGKDEHGDMVCVKVHEKIENNPVGYCGRCGKRLDDTFMKYCSNCGAKMDRGEQDG